MFEFWKIFTSQEPAGIAVTALIGVFVLVGLADVARSWARLVRETRLVRAATARLKKTSAPLPTESAQAILRFLQIPRGGLFAGRIERVMQLREGGLGYREMLQRLTLEQIEGQGAHSRYIASVLTILGLVGTVIGMSQAMLRISGAFGNVGDTRALAQLTGALGGTLEGMKTAFACTLAGLAGAVLLSLLNHFLRHLQSAFARELEQFVVCHLAPALERVDPEADNAARAFASVLTNASAQLVKMGETLSLAGEAFGAGSGRVQTAAAALEAAVERLCGQVDSLGKHQETLSQSVSSTGKSVDDLARVSKEELKQVREISQRLGEGLEEKMKGLRANLEALGAAQESMASFKKGFEAFVAESGTRMEGAFKQLVEGVSGHYQTEVKREMDGAVRQLSEVLAAHNAKLQTFADMMIELHIDGAAARSDGDRHETFA